MAAINAVVVRCEEIGCKSTFRFKAGPGRHTQKVHKKIVHEKRYPCGLCSKILKTAPSLQIHLRAHTGEKPFKCTECNFTAGNQHTRDNHAKTQHSEVYDFPCNFPGCEAKFKLKQYLKQHVDSVHKKITRFRCPDCPKEFFNQHKSKIHHMRSHSREKPYECNLCEYRAVSCSEIRKHNETTHGEYLNLECTDCDRKFKNADTLKHHWNNKHMGKPRNTARFACSEPDCGKEYQSKAGLKLHIGTCHTASPKQFKCSFCSFASTQLTDLVAHTRRHTGEAPCKCEECGKCFKQLSGLNTHKHIHLEEKNFKCKLCTYEGKTKSYLKMHQKCHNLNPTKPFSCPACPYKCTRREFLRNHSVTHREERPFKCQQCSFRAKLNYVLRKHMKSHAAHGLYTCSECQGAFRNKIGLGSHQYACRLSKIKSLSSDAATVEDCKPCFVRVVRLKL